MGWMRDETGLKRRTANYVSLTPLSYLQRAALVFADREAVVYGKTRLTYARYYRRVSRLASALKKVVVQPGAVVATILPNVPAQSEAAFGVPACGAVLNTINTRLDVDTVAYIFDHAEAKVALVDSQFLPLAMAAIELMDGPTPLVIEVPDDQAGVHAIAEQQNYEDFFATGDPEFSWILPADAVATHFGGAPIVLNLLVNAKDSDRRRFDHTVEVFTAGAPPAPATLAAIGKLGFNVKQVYGLTETYGHVTECIWDNAWDGLPEEEQAAIKARQGVAMPMMEEVIVADDHMGQVPCDGATQGEIVMRGNAVMKGYLKNPEAMEKAFAGGYFHSEDLAIQHPGGAIQISDRAKDIILSGGENISSVEVEGALMHHTAVNLCAVVAQPDETWGGGSPLRLCRTQRRRVGR